METTIAPPALSELLTALRSVKDQKDALAARTKELNKQEAGLEVQILFSMEAAGFTKSGDKVSCDAGTATRQTKWRAKYDPEKWEAIVAWCAANGRADLVQRRLADSRIMELVDLGKPLPDGVEPECYTDLSFRRS